MKGLITAVGKEDAVVDLVLRVEGVSLPTGDGVTDLLLAAKLVNKLPICLLRCLANGQDVLTLVMPAEAPYVYKFQALPEQKAVEMRLPLGFTAAAALALRLRAPFQIVLYQTKSALAFSLRISRILSAFSLRLHKLDERTAVEKFVLASAQWGEFPSTGRFVREGYQSYGDVCHSYYPALVEMSRAGWEPEPLCEGVRAERFGRKELLYFTVRAPQDARRAHMLILPPALKGLKNPVVMDAVQLTPIPARMTTQGLQIEFCDRADVLTILRISSPDKARRWLLERAALHCDWGARVRAGAEHTPRLRSLAQQIRLILQPREAAPLVKLLQQEISLVKTEPESLEKKQACSRNCATQSVR